LVVWACHAFQPSTVAPSLRAKTVKTASMPGQEQHDPGPLAPSRIPGIFLAKSHMDLLLAMHLDLPGSRSSRSSLVVVVVYH
jgi:hypothetical protein